MKLNDIKTRKNLPSFLNKNGLGGSGAEVGVRKGAYSTHILTEWNGNILYSIDCWEPHKDGRPNKHYPFAIDALSVFGDRSIILKDYSETASKKIKNLSLDFCYIDANHRYEHVIKDLEVWWPKVKNGGVFCGHDYSIDEHKWNINRNKKGLPSRQWPHWGVKKAVTEFCNKKNLSIHVDTTITTDPTSWYTIKNV